MKNMHVIRILLFLILILALFFRIYKLEVFYPWGHDQDLFAWIAKDILIDHHPRLIGQETSITGVFIGPLFYYLIAASFAFFNMNPLSASVITVIVSMVTIVSIYWVFSKFFNKNIGLIGSFLYAISPGTIFLDRWVVPTQPTILWSVWFLYILLSILNKNFQILIPLSILIGLIWHVHIAFIPLLILLPIAFKLSGGKIQNLKYDKKTLLVSFLILFVLLFPLITFEIKHGFQQIQSLIEASYENKDHLIGVDRMIKVLNSGGRSLAGAFLLSNTVIGLPLFLTSLLPFILLLVIILLYYLHILSKKYTILFVLWFIIVFFGQFFSKRIITEYYFNNLFIILFLLLALAVNELNRFKRFPLVIFLALIYLIVVISWFITRSDDLGGFLYKRQVVEYIRNNATSKNYQCIAINHIEGQPGGGNGFRYLYWLNKLNVITAGNDVPVYNIVNPWQISEKEIDIRFGKLGVIIPPKDKYNSSVCSKSDRQLLPLWGFNN